MVSRVSVNIILESAFELIQKIAQKSPPKTTLFQKSHQKIAKTSSNTSQVLQIILTISTEKGTKFSVPRISICSQEGN